MSALALALVPASGHTRRRAKPKLKRVTVADLFCGAGGSSTGASQALSRLGYVMDLVAVNHWNLAIDTHTRNHPTARHYCQDLASLKPRDAIPEGTLDLLMASPTCTFHSRARGGRPTSDQQRMDPNHVCMWLTELRVKRLIIENVPEFIKWGPIDERTGRPIKSRQGEYFRAWVKYIEGLRFKVEWRILNAADFGDATTRERFFLQGRADGKPIVWPTPTHSRTGDTVRDLFGTRALKKWRPAREIIDWNLKGRSIFDRKKALSAKTLARILAGAVKFKWPAVFVHLLEEHYNDVRGLGLGLIGSEWRRDRGLAELLMVDRVRAAAWAYHESRRPTPAPMVTVLRNHADCRTVDESVPTVTATGTHLGLTTPEPFVGIQRGQSIGRDIDSPLPTATGSGQGHLAVVQPVDEHSNAVVFQMNQSRERMRSIHSADEPLVTITATGTDLGLVQPESFILNRHGDNGGGARASGIEEPAPTATTSGAGYVVEPVVVRTDMHQSHAGCVYSPEDPLRTATTSGGLGLAQPFVASMASERGAHRSVEEPIGTQHASGNAFGIAEPFVLAPAYGGAPRSVEEPVPSIVSGTNSIAHSVAQPFVLSQAQGGAPREVAEPVPTIATDGAVSLIAPYYGNAQTCSSTTQPVPTVTTKDRFGIVVPVTHTHSEVNARDVGSPFPTITTAKGGEHAFVIPVTHHGESDRARDPEVPLPTITGANRGEYSFITAQHGERPGQEPRVHSIDAPTPTVTAAGHVNLVARPEGGFDITFRMFEPKELAAAMGFPEGEAAYEFAGTKTDKIKQIGNAVCVNLAAALVGAMFQ